MFLESTNRAGWIEVVCGSMFSGKTEELIRRLKRVNRSLSMFNKNSVIARWNRGESEQVDSLFVVMYEKAREVNEVTGGAVQ